MKRIMVLLLGILFCVTAAMAEIPELISFQAKIEGRSNQKTTLVFDIVDSRGTVLWTETYADYLIPTDGFVNILLGKQTPISLAFDRPYSLRITVDNVPMFPNQELTTAPYAFTSKNLEGGIVDAATSASGASFPADVASAVKGASSAATGYNAGVLGTASSTDHGSGITGVAPFMGVVGLQVGDATGDDKADAAGVAGRALGSAFGVFGNKPAEATDAKAAVYGLNEAKLPLAISQNPGVKGESVYGYGVVGVGGRGAALFAGDVNISGNINLTGGQLFVDGNTISGVSAPLDLQGRQVTADPFAPGFVIKGQNDSEGNVGDLKYGVGVHGHSEASNGSGVYGSGRNVGVAGYSNGKGSGDYQAGVAGVGENSAFAVMGRKFANAADERASVYGLNERSVAGENAGVKGESRSGYGVVGSGGQGAALFTGDVNISNGKVLASGKQVSNDPLNPGHIIFGDNQSQGVLNSKHGTGIYGNSQALNGAGVFGKGVNVGVSGY
ncbi:MAG: hypothetical protein KKH83_08370, partial [Candidatus Margulisbacteria bacterium]|nr:hypothetical protein [Candidatus Margulisiibacteriota bacterium]